MGQARQGLEPVSHMLHVDAVRRICYAAVSLMLLCVCHSAVLLCLAVSNNCKLRTNLVGHQGYVNTVTVSPDGSLCASGGKDGVAMLWDL